MMPEGPATILGGLPVIAEVWFTRGDGWMTDDDAGVDALYWQKRDGSKGKPLPQSIYDRLDKKDPYWQADVTEQVSEHLAYQDWVARQTVTLLPVPDTTETLKLLDDMLGEVGRVTGIIEANQRGTD